MSLRGRFVEQKLMLSSNFRCDQIHKNKRYGFGHTLLCYLNVAEGSLLNKSSCLARALDVTKFITIRDMVLVALCCAT